MRFASTRSKGPQRAATAAHQRAPSPRPALDPSRERGCGGRWRASPRRRWGRCPRPARSARRASRRRWPGCPSRSPRRAPVRRRCSPSSAQRSMPARHSRVVGCSPVPKAMPGSSARTTSPGCGPVAPPGRPDDQPPADAQHREVLLPGRGPILLVDRPHLEVADGPQPERLEMAQVPGHRSDGRLRRPRRRSPGCRRERRRAAWLGVARQPLVHERRTAPRPTRRRAPRAQDLADRLDRLLVDLDRQLQPGPGGRRCALVPAVDATRGRAGRTVTLS